MSTINEKLDFLNETNEEILTELWSFRRGPGIQTLNINNAGNTAKKVVNGGVKTSARKPVLQTLGVSGGPSTKAMETINYNSARKALEGKISNIETMIRHAKLDGNPANVVSLEKQLAHLKINLKAMSNPISASARAGSALKSGYEAISKSTYNNPKFLKRWGSRAVIGAAGVYGVNKLRKRYLSAAAQSCAGKSGAERSICIRAYINAKKGK